MNCPKCGAPVGPEDAFCPNCGAPLRAPTAAPSRVSAPAGTPRRSRPAILILITILTALNGLGLLAASFSLISLLVVFWVVDQVRAAAVPQMSGLMETLRKMPPGSVEQQLLLSPIKSLVSFLVSPLDPPVWALLAVCALWVLSASFLGASYGLYALEPWAPQFAFVLWALFVLVPLIGLLFVSVGRTWMVLILLGIAVAVFTLYHLLRPDLRRLYR